MKKVCLLIAFLLAVNLVYSQADIPKHYELKGRAYTQADSILDVWMKTEYPKFIKNNKVKMTCKKCTNYFMDVIFSIDQDGTFVDYEVVNSNQCSREFDPDTKAGFVFFFSQLKFPPSLRNMKIQFRLGTGLKC